jgi:hypothetical protein
MPGRPPKSWFARCVDDVAASGHAVNPAAVCGATWRDKSPAEKALTIALEEPTMKKASKKGSQGKHVKKGSHGKHGKHGTRTKATRSAHREGHGGKKEKHHHRCPACGHSARHDARAGCTHFEGSRFCPCRHRHR